MDDIVAAVKSCLTKYAEFTGRAARPEFWWFMLAQLVAVLVVSMVSVTLGNLVSLGLLVPSLAVGARRLHDIGKSGWLQLVGLIPLIGWGLLIYWFAQPGQTEGNQYGAPANPVAPGVPAAPGQQ
ncbi:MAG TPA: DUF805 domain-containing protein [Ramlibacter sp.]|nr:DUF805 domain-containing protein [Ramlibacter sp.]